MLGVRPGGGSPLHNAARAGNIQSIRKEIIGKNLDFLEQNKVCF